MQIKQTLHKRYQLKKKLGQNAGRQTWLATDIETSPPSPVIVKLLAFNPQMQWDDLKLFEREAQVLKNINHSRIPQYRDYFSMDDLESSGFIWFGLVQEYIPGKSFKQLLDQGKKLTQVEVCLIAIEILQILIYLHEISPPVLHRDIKPSNLILGKNNQIYLVDFGAVQDRAKSEGATFTVVGTSGYAPPEQLWGKAVPASDLYALGATLIHLLTGISPAELPQHKMQIHFKDKVNINPDFANWIEKLVQPAPERRFSRARQALEVLQTINNSIGKKAPDVERARNSPNYIIGGLIILFNFGLFFFVLVGLQSLLLGDVRKAKQAEAKNNIGALNRAQQAYFLEYQKFTDDFSQLGTGIKPETPNYRYSIHATDKGVLNYGVSRQKNLKSYVGGVFAVPATNNIDSSADKKEIITIAIFCETVRPHPEMTKPSAPILQNGAATCGEDTKDLLRKR
jgi:serine/threonine protein kinase